MTLTKNEFFMDIRIQYAADFIGAPRKRANKFGVYVNFAAEVYFSHEDSGLRRPGQLRATSLTV